MLTISNINLKTFEQYQNGTRSSYIYNGNQTPTPQETVLITLDPSTTPLPPITELTGTITHIIQLNTFTSNLKTTVITISINP